MTFGSIDEKTIVKQTISPNELYMATVISVDSGVLGGATTVIVEEIPTSIKWKDDHMLLINGNAFRMQD